MKKIKISPAVLLLTSQLFSQENSECYQEWKRMNASKDALYEFYNDLKLGLFIHWGAYSKPAGTWKGEKIPGLGEWIMYLGK